MAVKVKTWVWVVVGIAVVCILGIVAMAGIGIYYFSQHVETKMTTPAAAAAVYTGITRGRPAKRCSPPPRVLPGTSPCR